MKIENLEEIAALASHHVYLAKLHGRISKLDKLELGEPYGITFTLDLTPELRRHVLSAIETKWAAATHQLRCLGVEFDASVTIESMASAVGRE